MTNTKQTFKLTTIGAALLVAYGPAFADDAEINALIKPDSSVSFGIGGWSNNRPHQGIFDGMRENGAYGQIDADVVKRDDATGTWLTFYTRNLGTTPELGIGYERQGDFKAGFRYDEITRDNPYTFMTATTGIGSTALVTPSVANRPLSEVTLGTKRKKFDLDFVKHLFPGTELSLNFKQEKKSGTRQWGRGGAPEFSVEPIDATTRQLEIVLSHVGERLQLSGGYYGSWYDNANSLVTTDLSTFAAGSRYYLSLPLDNQAHQLFLNGGYSFTPTTRGTVKIEYSRATQNERIPTGDIAGLAAATAPKNLNGRIDTTLYQFGLTARPTRDLSLVANLRYKHETDKTPVVLVVTGTTPVHNTPYDYKTLSGKLEGTYRLPANFSLVGGLDMSNQDRSIPVGTIAGGLDVERYVPFRSELKENTLRLQLRRSLSDTLNGSIAFLHAKRTGSAHTQTDESMSDFISPIHLADRKRDKWRLAADWSPMDSLSVQANYENSKDDYRHDGARIYGLLDGKGELFSLDATYNINDNSKITAWYSYDESRANQMNGRWDRLTDVHELDRVTHLKDVANAIGLGFRGKATSQLAIGADLQWTQTRSEYPSDFRLTGAGPLRTAYPADVTPLPSITNKILTLKLFGEYAIDKKSDLRIDFIHERWSTNDWTWMFSGGAPFAYDGANAAALSDGTQVRSNGKQSSNFIGARYIYRFQ